MFSRVSTLLGFAVAALLAPSIARAAPTKSGHVMTPHGARPIENVHQVPADGRVELVGDKVHLVDSSGKVLHIATNTGSNIRNPSSPTSPSAAAAALATGWVAYAGWSNPSSSTNHSPISYFSTTWTVPPVPRSKDGQTVFLFNSIEPASGTAIVQPVLQWGGSAAGGGNYWSVASWYVVGSESYYTPLVTVTPGTVLEGLITYIGRSNGGQWQYISSFGNIPASTLYINSPDELVWATETLEAYGITRIADYPAGQTVFSGVNLRLENGKIPDVEWSAYADTKDGLKTLVNKQGAVDAKITIGY